mmetsp:Transcript_20552/g.57296  ORF Transcript_20552/g.57296 Transcript_20552/m.57296 type:complete len:209 (-) Transcript_20552:540-1166(-)
MVQCWPAWTRCSRLLLPWHTVAQSSCHQGLTSVMRWSSRGCPCYKEPRLHAVTTLLSWRPSMAGPEPSLREGGVKAAHMQRASHSQSPPLRLWRKAGASMRLHWRSWASYPMAAHQAYAFSEAGVANRVQDETTMLIGWSCQSTAVQPMHAFSRQLSWPDFIQVSYASKILRLHTSRWRVALLRRRHLLPQSSSLTGPADELSCIPHQ